MSKPRLIYFSGRGRAEIPRLLFAYANLPYEDVRLSREEFAELKPKLPALQLPVLQIDGEYYPQTQAIERYVARKAGLYPIDTEQAFTADIVREHLNDAAAGLVAIFLAPDDKKAEARTAFLTTFFPAYLERVDKILTKSGGVYFTGVGTSYADIATFHFLDMAAGVGDEAVALIERFPTLKALKERVAAIPNIAKYLEARPPA